MAELEPIGFIVVGTARVAAMAITVPCPVLAPVTHPVCHVTWSNGKELPLRIQKVTELLLFSFWACHDADKMWGCLGWWQGSRGTKCDHLSLLANMHHKDPPAMVLEGAYVVEVVVPLT